MSYASPRQRRLAMSVALALSAAPLATAILHGAGADRPRPGESAPVGVARAPETTAKDGAKPLSWAAVMTFNFAYVKVDDAFKARLAATPANRLKMLRKFAAFEAKHNFREQFCKNAQAVVEAIDAAGPGQPPSDPPPSDPPPSDPPPSPSDPPPSPSDPPPSPSDPPPSPSDPPPSPSDPPPSPSDPPPSPSDPPPSPSDPPPSAKQAVP